MSRSQLKAPCPRSFGLVIARMKETPHQESPNPKAISSPKAKPTAKVKPPRRSPGAMINNQSSGEAAATAVANRGNSTTRSRTRREIAFLRGVEAHTSSVFQFFSCARSEKNKSGKSKGNMTSKKASHPPDLGWIILVRRRIPKRQGRIHTAG